MVFLLTLAVTEWQSDIIHSQAERAEVRETVAQIQTRMESIVHSDVQLLRGLVASIALHPEM